MVTPARPRNAFVDFVDEILRISGRIQSVFGELNAGTGLSGLENTVLAAVVEARAPPTVPQIGRSLGHPRQVIQRAVNRLMEDGFLETSDNPDHKRARLLLATPKGLELKDVIDSRAKEITEQLLHKVGPELCKRATRDLHDLRLSIENHVKTHKG
jgi:DNA-binding MarR family transcriptional regulator